MSGRRLSREVNVDGSGHFCGSDRCGWHMHTHVNGWCVSSVGEYRPKNHRGCKTEPIGYGPAPKGGRLYETMVFALVDDSHQDRWRDALLLPGWTRDEAVKNHALAVNEMAGQNVADWLKKLERERATWALEVES